MEDLRMTRTVPDVLTRIVEHKRAELEERRSLFARWEPVATEEAASRRDFRAALVKPGLSIIAELKKASPSVGVIAEDFNPVAIAEAYERGGAAALSVLTDERFFQGSLLYLKAARAATKTPVLRKDFTIDEYHVVEAAAHGADAVLLIAAILTAEEMRRFRERAAEYKMAALVEVHSEEELGPAVDSGAEIIGVNNRNLHSFEVTLDTSLKLAEKIPAGVVKVSESGIRSAADIATLSEAGYDAFLVGEHLMKADDPGAALRELLS
jgi:indole-3-glycerol phosphate synthase